MELSAEDEFEDADDVVIALYKLLQKQGLSDEMRLLLKAVRYLAIEQARKETYELEMNELR